MKNFAVIGAGQMGAGIAQVAAQSGMQVLLNDISRERAEAGKAGIAKALQRLVDKGKMEAGKVQEILGLIQPVGNLADLKNADFIVEAATEKVELKYEIFRKLDEIAKPGVILATNTSSISITAIAGANQAPGRSGGHAFYESRAGDETGGGDPRLAHIRCYVQHDEGLGGEDGQNRGGSP